MYSSIRTFVAILAAVSVLNAQDQPVKETQFKVEGNCGMCKTRIEKTLKIKPVKFARWNKETKLLTVAYLPSSISLDSLQRRLAAVGHDTQRYKAPDSVYATLPGCCRYRDSHSAH